jgi:magnesium transporter
MGGHLGMSDRQHKIPRPRIGTRKPASAQKPFLNSPSASSSRLVRYVTDGVAARASADTSLAEALSFASGSDNRMSMVLFAEPTTGDIEELAEAWDLHPLLVEDLIKGHQRPKLERYDDVLFLVARSAWYVDEEETVEFAEFHVVLRDDAVVLLCQDRRWIDGTDVTAFDLDDAGTSTQRNRNLIGDPNVMRLGPEAVAYQLLDAIVDGYAPVLEGLEIDKDEIERQVFSGDAAAAERIYRLSREVIDLKQASTSLGGVVSSLIAGFQKYGIDEELQTYLGDLSDHLTRVNVEVAALHEALTQILTVNATLVGQRQNEDMKKISGWAAILFAPTLIAAVYGMNFDNMPELHWAWGYPLAVAMMVGFAALLYWIFKRRRWM